MIEYHTTKQRVCQCGFLLPFPIFAGFGYWVRSFEERTEWGAATALREDAEPFLRLGKDSSVLLD